MCIENQSKRKKSKNLQKQVKIIDFFNQIEIKDNNQEENSTRYLSKLQKQAIVVFKEYETISETIIAKKEGCSRSDVNKIYNKYLKIGDVENQFKNCGRQGKLLEQNMYQQLEEAIQIMKQTEPFLCAKQLKEQFSILTNINFSYASFYKALHELGYSYKTAKITQAIIEVNVQKKISSAIFFLIIIFNFHLIEKIYDFLLLLQIF
ncbi:hypothetical protein ABPG72_009748 [Tetrahymena utriculariae]